ncbi:MAG TPA: hypothetical protein VGO97_00995 [Solirubrobacterales bacterium]|jgi:hypothetical protein|nr:hypothetical protein [Solirubrobacterales bacterium]
MNKAVEIQWNLTPFRSDEFCELWAPYAELAINYGASGYLMIRQADDQLIVKQYAMFDNKADWDAYWNSEALQEGRAKVTGMYTVPIVYVWEEVVTEGYVNTPEPAAAQTEA